MASRPSPLLPSCQDSTSDRHLRAVERVIRTMHEQLGEEWTLQSLAKVAFMSPYHFNRIFHEITGIPPYQFLWALRLETAKRLLITSRRSVIDICFDVGYNSLGTFNRRFKELVGVPPLQLRRVARTLGKHWDSICEAETLSQTPDPTPSSGHGVTGHVEVPESCDDGDDGDELILVGLFQTPIPKSKPVGCCLLAGHRDFQIAPVPDGRYYLFAAASKLAEDSLPELHKPDALRGTAGRPVLVRKGSSRSPVTVEMRRPRLTDPPILISLPLLFAERLGLAMKDPEPELKPAASTIEPTIEPVDRVFPGPDSGGANEQARRSQTPSAELG